MTLITRFAPSPTGYLHIGGARTALFNYLFAKANNGKFLLRIEDTDKERSNLDATQAIFDSLQWLGIEYDDEVIYQSERSERHKKIAYDLVKSGKAYRCFSTQEEISQLRNKAVQNKQNFVFISPWRDIPAKKHPENQNFVIRIKSPKDGKTIVHDLLQGDVVVQNDHLEDFVILRGDGTPTYMLAVVVDDHDMGITHIIRGDDHLTNAHKQQILYDACGFNLPKMVHIPLIHGQDGAKLSKRHGALGVEHYQALGYLPEAICNYLLRLGWSHGDDEIINIQQAIKWFDIAHLGKAPSRLDFDKMKYINAHYLRAKNNIELLPLIIDLISKDHVISDISRNNIFKAIDSLKARSELLNDLAKMALIYVVDFPLKRSDEALKIIKNIDKVLLEQIISSIESIEDFFKDNIKEELKKTAIILNLKLGELMKYVRAIIAGTIHSPSVFEMMEILGKQEVMKRIRGI